MAVTMIPTAFLVIASFLAGDLLVQVQGSHCEDVDGCIAEANQTTLACRNFLAYVGFKNLPVCDNTDKNLKAFCRASCTPDGCIGCYDKIDKIAEECANFYRLMGQTDLFVDQKCGYIRRSVQSYCGASSKCPICQDSFCKNGGRCYSSRSSAFKCQCLPAFSGVYCQTGACDAHPCQNGGTCIGVSKCQCPTEFTGLQCQTARYGFKNNPAPSGEAILDAGHSRGSGLYWIQPPGESEPAETYVDMDNYGGGWMLASYGFTYTTSACHTYNRNMPNMNIPYGFNWLPAQRQSSHGVINLPHGAVYLARSAKQMIMAASVSRGNPNSGGIDQYTHVYRVNISSNPYTITFANHNREYGAIGQRGIPQMHITNFTIEGLKGDSGTVTRYALGEALGVTSDNNYQLTGYGFHSSKDTYCISCVTGGPGPFFPSIHTKGGCGPSRQFKPDVNYNGDTRYSYCGWRTMHGSCVYGQMSIWFN